MMSNVKKFWLAILLLVILTPLGLIIPAWFGAGGAWGEWSLEEIEKLIGYVPKGMERLSHLWHSPMPDYTVPGQERGILHDALGYLVTAVIGVAVTGGLAYALARLLGGKNSSKQ